MEYRIYSMHVSSFYRTSNIRLSTQVNHLTVKYRIKDEKYEKYEKYEEYEKYRAVGYRIKK